MYIAVQFCAIGLQGRNWDACIFPTYSSATVNFLICHRSLPNSTGLPLDWNGEIMPHGASKALNRNVGNYNDTGSSHIVYCAHERKR